RPVQIGRCRKIIEILALILAENQDLFTIDLGRQKSCFGDSTLHIAEIQTWDQPENIGIQYKYGKKYVREKNTFGPTHFSEAQKTPAYEISNGRQKHKEVHRLKIPHKRNRKRRQNKPECHYLLYPGLVVGKTIAPKQLKESGYSQTD